MDEMEIGSVEGQNEQKYEHDEVFSAALEFHVWRRAKTRGRKRLD